MSSAVIQRFRNHYKCPSCQHSWEDAWDSMVDDDCPECGYRHVSPYQSDDIEPPLKLVSDTPKIKEGFNLLFSYGVKDDENFASEGHRFLGAGLDSNGSEVHIFLHKDYALCGESDG